MRDKKTGFNSRSGSLGVISLVAVLIAALLALSPQAGPADATAAALDQVFEGNAWAGFEQFTVTGAEPGATVKLAVQRGRGNGQRVVDTATADALGSVLFREVAPRKNYRAQVGTSRSPWDRVRSVDAPHPDQSFYDGIDIGSGYQYLETRDGTTLSINVSLPGPAEDGPYPTVVEYSGYDPSNPTGGAFPGIAGMAQPSSMIATVYGYAVVGINVRGTGCSGGAYDFFEPMQLLDGYDAIEAVAAQPWVKDHEVGMVGLSYPGISQLFVGSTNPPSLVAITPLSVYGDTGSGIARPGGLPNRGFALNWADNVLNNARPYPNGTAWVRKLIDEGDAVCAANQALRLQNVDASQKALENPYYTDEVAGPLDARRFVGDIEAAVFMTSAWQDEQTGPSFGDILGEFDSAAYVRQTVFNGNHADGYAPQNLTDWAAFLDIYVAKRVPKPNPIVNLLAPTLTQGIFGGPLAMEPTCCQGAATVHEARAMFESEPPIQVIFESGGQRGANEGLPIGVDTFGTESWPVPGTTARRWYFDRSGLLIDARPDRFYSAAYFRPNVEDGLSTYMDGVSDDIWHAKPNYNWEPAADGESIAFETPALSEDTTMIGTGSVDLWLKSTASEADLEVVLSEIRPDGQEMLVQTGVQRGTYRKTDPSSTELKPVQYGREDEVAPLLRDVWNMTRVQIPAFAHEFRRGSQIRITINSPGGDEPEWSYILSDGVDASDKHFVSLGRFRASSIALPLVDSYDVPTPLPSCPSLRGQPCREAPPINNRLTTFVDN